MIYYKLIKTIINSAKLSELIIHIVIRYLDLSNSIVSNKRMLFTSKFWSYLYYFLDIKQTLFISFHLQTDSKTKKQNSIIKAYLPVFINLELNALTKFLFLAEFA